jgi:hypothetical protein
MRDRYKVQYRVKFIGKQSFRVGVEGVSTNCKFAEE